MGKVSVIKKSRKEYKCSKCGNVIPVGSTYYKGEINFGPTIVRCSNCKLESWEVTTSDYQLAAGEIVYRWKENYGEAEDAVDNIISDLQNLADDLEGRLDNMPEGLQEGDIGQLLQERIDTLESVISDLECIDIDSMKDDISSVFAEEHLTDEEREDEPSWDDIIVMKGDEAEKAMSEMLDEALTEDIDNALAEIEV